MTLTSKFHFWVAVLLLGVCTLGAVSIWNIASLWHGTRAATAAYEAMDYADGVANQIGWLRDVLRGADARNYRDIQFFTPIQTEVRAVVSALESAASTDDGDAAAELSLAKSLSQHLDAAIAASAAAPADRPAAKLAESATELDRARQQLVAVTKLVPAAARRHTIAAGVRLHDRLIITCIILLIVLVLSVIVHYRQFRALVRPLHWLLDDMRQSAKTEYLEPVRPRGEREFKDVAAAFNGLARALAELYRSMEQKIIVRSRELVRSERLASVGFLAAGVAHEINNPLGVISGYAEMTLKRLRGLLLGPPAGPPGKQSEAEAEAEAEALSGAMEAQTMIRDEAFRCKEITNRLLSLSRGGGDGRQKLALDETARQVALLTKGLRNYRDRRIVMDFGGPTPLEVMANPTEMKQVFMNLTVNALEAAAAQQGEVKIGGQRVGDSVEVFVQDNGKGMSPEMLERVFEPFFTAKRGAGEPGTGLGLSITHAIVESHGGQIRAESRGPGKGSRFTVRLPAIVSTATVNEGALAIGT